MKTRLLTPGTILVFAILICVGGVTLMGKDKTPPVGPDDPTVRLYGLLDSKYNGKLDDFCLLADTINDPANQGQTQQHVLRVSYAKTRAFGKLVIFVRTVSQLTPEQLKTYTPAQIFDFAETDSAKFTKTDPGSFGRAGDLYFQPTSPGGPLGTATVTPDVDAQYERLINQFILPALDKKPAEASGSGG